MEYSEQDKQRFWSRVAIIEDEKSCWLWKGHRSPQGYGMFSLHGKEHTAHSVAWRLQHGNLPSRYRVFHIPPCRERLCVRHIDALPSQPLATRYRGPKKSGYGEQVATHKLTDEMVHFIRDTWEKKTHTMQELAQMFSVSRGLIWQVIKRKTRAYL